MIAVQQRIDALGMPLSVGIPAHGYIRKVIQPGEVIRYEGRLHWIGYLMPAIWLFGAIALAAAVPILRGPSGFAAGLLAVLVTIIALVKFIRAWFTRWTTEVIATDRRVLVVKGFIRRDTVEMNAAKIETVDIDQSALGRFLNFST
jgi:hypothetical protein